MLLSVLILLSLLCTPVGAHCFTYARNYTVSVELIVELNPSLFSPFQGMLLNVAVALRYGWWGTLAEDPQPMIGCNAEAFLLWFGAGGLVACAFLRVYRSHRVLILHNAGMWPVLLQLTVLLLPFLFPLAFFALRPMVIDDDTEECERQSEEPEAFAFGGLVFLAVLTTVLTCRLEAVRFQVQLLIVL